MLNHVPQCVVETRGMDHEDHSLTVEAISIFDAADKGHQSWALHAWFDPEAVINVSINEKVWCITPSLLREWRRQVEACAR